eukprot:Gb_18752 [translate_table: standard]
MEIVTENDASVTTLEDAIKQRDAALREKEEIAQKLDQTSRQRDDLEKEIESVKRFAEETEGNFNGLKLKIFNHKPLLSQHLIHISKVQENLEKILTMIDDTKFDPREHFLQQFSSDQPKLFSDQPESFSEDSAIDEDLHASLVGAKVVSELAASAESAFRNYAEKNKKEKKELGNSIISLTEENRDISTLLRSALAEKEAAEKAFTKSRGGSDHRKGAIFQIAERGLQKVGFGFRVGAFGDPESVAFNGGASGAEGEDEVFGLAFAMESIIKSTRLEISELRQSLETSRAEVDHLRELSVTQAQDLAKNNLHIKELEERVECLIMDIAAAEEEIVRWREACELEAAAGKAVMEECQMKVSTLNRELEEMKQSLDEATKKLKSKEELAAAAMAAREAAERSLGLADSRVAGLRERIEELTRQFEELDGRGERNSLARMRYVCWPWRWLKITPIGNYRDMAVHT